MRRQCGAIGAAFLAALLTTNVASARTIRYCLLFEPGITGYVPTPIILSQFSPPQAGDAVRVVIGDATLADVVIAQRPGLRDAQLLALTRLIHQPTGPGPPLTSPDWRPDVRQCTGDMAARVIIVGTITDAIPPESLPSSHHLPEVTLIDLPNPKTPRDIDAWLDAWPPDTRVFVLPLATPAPVLPPKSDSTGG